MSGAKRRKKNLFSTISDQTNDGAINVPALPTMGFYLGVDDKMAAEEALWQPILMVRV